MLQLARRFVGTATLFPPKLDKVPEAAAAVVLVAPFGVKIPMAAASALLKMLMLKF